MGFLGSILGGVAKSAKGFNARQAQKGNKNIFARAAAKNARDGRGKTPGGSGGRGGGSRSK